MEDMPIIKSNMSDASYFAKLALKEPLWKTSVSDQEYDVLKKLLRNNLLGFRGVEKTLLNKLTALYYASWWRYEYMGGIPTKEAIAASLDLKDETGAIYKMAKEGLRHLRIKPIKGAKNTLWFRTLLVQGGLPMACISSQRDQLSGFKDFLGKLIEYTSTYVVNWDNSEFIGELPFLYKLPKSFQNEEIFELCLQISKAISEGDDTLLPFDLKVKEWQDLTQELKSIKSRERKHNVNLAIRWFVKKTEVLKLFFQVELPKLIPATYLKNKEVECNSFQLFASEVQLATYDRSNEEYYVLRQNSNQYVEWKNETAVGVIIRTNTGQLHSISLPNNLPPSFDNPILVIQTPNFWTVQATLSNSYTNTIFFDQNIWAPYKSEIIQIPTAEFKLGAKSLSAIDTVEEIDFINLTSGETTRYDHKISNYNYEFSYPFVQWMNQTTCAAIDSSPKIYVYGEDGSRLNSSIYEVLYRSLEHTNPNWLKYQPNKLLPLGKVEFKIIYPDKKNTDARFFNIGGLCFDVKASDNSSCEIEFKGELDLKISAIANQKGIECVKNNGRVFEFKRTTEGAYYPTHIEFQAVHSSGNIRFRVVAPFKGISIYDSEKNVQISGSICLTSLYHYHLFSMGEPAVCKLYHSLNSGRVFTQKMPEGVHCLTQFEASINRLSQLNEYDVDNSKSYIRLECKSGSKHKLLLIKDFNLNVDVNPEIREILVLNDSGNPAVQLVQINCIDLLSTEVGTIKCVKLAKNANGFNFPDFAIDGSAFLVFSDTHSSEKISPTVVSINCPEFDSNFVNFAPILRNSLNHAVPDDNSWKTVVRLFDIAACYSLPFSTFGHFKIIATSPILLVKMVYVLWNSSSLGSNALMEHLLRFENEMGVAFHWIDNNIWYSGCYDWFIQQFNNPEMKVVIDVIVGNLMRNRKNFINYSFKSEGAFSVINDAVRNKQKTIDMTLITEIRQLVDEEKNLIDCRIEIPNEWISNVFPLAFKFGNNSLVPKFNEIKTLLLSPFKAALAASGKDNSLWDKYDEEHTKKTRRAILFYRAYRPEIYYQIFENTFTAINHVNA